MKRREFIAGLGGVAAGGARAGRDAARRLCLDRRSRDRREYCWTASLNVDVLVTPGTPITRGAKRATSTVPTKGENVGKNRSPNTSADAVP
jgi:hypothetical protein